MRPAYKNTADAFLLLLSAIVFTALFLGAWLGGK